MIHWRLGGRIPKARRRSAQLGAREALQALVDTSKCAHKGGGEPCEPHFGSRALHGKFQVSALFAAPGARLEAGWHSLHRTHIEVRRSSTLPAATPTAPAERTALRPGVHRATGAVMGKGSRHKRGKPGHTGSGKRRHSGGWVGGSGGGRAPRCGQVRRSAILGMQSGSLGWLSSRQHRRAATSRRLMHGVPPACLPPPAGPRRVRSQ